MKKGILLLIILLPSLNCACPTAIGRLEGDTPPLFTPEYDAQFWPVNNEQPQTTTNQQPTPPQSKGKQ